MVSGLFSMDGLVPEIIFAFRFTVGEQMPCPVIVKTVRRVSFKAIRPYCFTAKGFEGFVY